ncbi:hypothetical protein FPHYL_12126 [Fusarium phyllophilum]|uniref:Uncharacterized protein n=1 Tax=Fusarium phyllophilum TaxID=47803 RepID=A0A8H5IQG0_9HYPO|nr:hypothetical protein FPHYL_12126 [Fusarium phyllophilum]
MKINIVVLIALDILPILSKSTGGTEIQIQCPSLPPNRHVSRLHCKLADGSLAHADGPGPFDCEMSYIAIRPPTSKGSTNQYSKESSNKGSEQCELLLIKLSDDGVLQHRCCQGGVAVFATEDHQVPSPQPIYPMDGMQEPMQHLQTDSQVVDEELQFKREEEFKDEYNDSGGGYDDDEGEEGSEDEDDDAEDEREEDEDEEEDYESYGVDEDINDGNPLDSEAGQLPEEFKDL